MPNTPSQNSSRWAKKNPEKVALYRQRWMAKNPTYLRAHSLRRKYGVTLDQWEEVFNAQGRICAICSTDYPGHRYGWQMDHDHEDGRLRGILCSSCNFAIAIYERKLLPNLDKAMAYLAGSTD